MKKVWVVFEEFRDPYCMLPPPSTTSVIGVANNKTGAQRVIRRRIKEVLDKEVKKGYIAEDNARKMFKKTNSQLFKNRFGLDHRTERVPYEM